MADKENYISSIVSMTVLLCIPQNKKSSGLLGILLLGYVVVFVVFPSIWWAAPLHTTAVRILSLQPSGGAKCLFSDTIGKYQIGRGKNALTQNEDYSVLFNPI